MALAKDYMVDVAGLRKQFQVRPERWGAKPRVVHAVSDISFKLRPGVTEVFFHPATDGPELRALAPDADQRVADASALAPDGEVARRVAAAGAHLVSYRALRDLQRG